MDSDTRLAEYKAAVLSRMDNDHTMASEIIALFLENAPTVMGKIRASVANGDDRGLILSAHNLKGMASTLDSTKVTASSARLEELARAGDLGTAGTVLAELESAMVLAIQDMTLLHNELLKK